MIERIREIGGELEINSKNYGTAVTVRVPAIRRPQSNPEVLPMPISEVRGS